MEAARGRLRRCRGLKGIARMCDTKMLQICEIFMLGYIQDAQTVFTKSIALKVVLFICVFTSKAASETPLVSHCTKLACWLTQLLKGMAKIFFF